MQKQNQSDSSEQEGFYKPLIKIEQPPQINQIQNNINSQNIKAIDLISNERPVDYIPRTLTISPQLHFNSYETYRDNGEREEMIEIIGNKVKKCKFNSLQEKYLNNSSFQLVYSKIAENSRFNSYIFSLENTTDYNPKDYHKPKNKQHNNLFDSCFESGNLLFAYKTENTIIDQYDLIMQNDTNTNGYNQWFYFSFQNKQIKQVKFNIVNFTKKHLMFQDGVRPVGFSRIEHQKNDKGWHFIGKNIEYQKSYVVRQINTNPITYKNYYTLSFIINFTHLNDTLFLALNYPYTYTKMINFIDTFAVNHPEIYVEKQIICYSISNNALPAIKVKSSKKDLTKKILLLARQHPGESVSSYVLEGFLKKIIKEIEFLKKYELIVIPMVNPDGVIYGNFRTNLAGFDLNRQWRNPDKWLHRQIYEIKKYVSKIENIHFLLDFHGHSKQLNSFIYSCIGQRMHEFHLFPYIYSKECQLFSLKDSTFSVTLDKFKTARITFFDKIKRPSVFTLQTSFFGFVDQSSKKYRFIIEDYHMIGQNAAQSVVIYLSSRSQLKIYEKEVKQKAYLFQKWALQLRKDLDSQSNPSEDELTPIERKQRVLSDKFKLKDKKHIQKSKIIKNKELRKITKHKLNKEEKKSESAIQPIKNKSKLDFQQKSDRRLNLIGHQYKKKRQYSYSERKIQLSQQKQIVSNIFNPHNFYSQLNLKIKQNSATKIQFQKTQSLQINVKKEQFETKQINNITEIVKKLIPSEEFDNTGTDILAPHTKPMRRRQKLYVIKDNKVVNSITRINDIEMKNRIEEEIHHRTSVLRKCQKRMNSEIDPIFSFPKSQFAEDQQYFNQKKAYIEGSSALKSYKFPAIFNFKCQGETSL